MKPIVKFSAEVTKSAAASRRSNEPTDPSWMIDSKDVSNIVYHMMIAIVMMMVTIVMIV